MKLIDFILHGLLAMLAVIITALMNPLFGFPMITNTQADLYFLGFWILLNQMGTGGK